MMRTFGRAVAMLALGTAILATGCAAIRLDPSDAENLLRAAGFVMRRADTVEQRARLQAMPPYRLQAQRDDGRVIYTYADPAGCHCVYEGGPREYARYHRLVQKEMAEDRRRDAEAWELWAPWGSWWW